MEQNLFRRFSKTIARTLSAACVILSLGVTCFAATAVMTVGNISGAPGSSVVVPVSLATTEILASDLNGDDVSSSGVTGSITVAAGPLTITTTSLSDGMISTVYNQIVSATGGITPYTWSISVPSLPDGLTLNASTGAISGTPTAVGISNFTVRVVDSKSPAATVTKELSIVINPVGLTITTTILPGGTEGTAYSQSVLATSGVTPYTWSISAGSLPSGLVINAGTGVISGTPTAVGISNFTVRVVDSKSPTSATAIKALFIVINSQPGFLNLKFYDESGNPITDNIFVDTPIRAEGDYTAGGDGSRQAMSQWVIKGRTLEDTVFVDTTVSDSGWLPANMLKPGMNYTLKGRAQNINGAWSEWVNLDFGTILQEDAADVNNDGVPDDQTPTDTDLRTYGFDPDSGLPDTALMVRFNNKPILVESADSDTMSYFAGITRSLEAPPLSGSNPYGVFTTRIEVLKGTPITLTYTFPEALPSGTAWYKYDESAPAGSKWSKYPDAVISGKTVTVELKDGGKGDADGVANGVIIDPAGLAVPPSTDGGGGGGGGPVGPLAAGISAFLVWLKRRKQR